MKGLTLPPSWFKFEITENDSGDCVQCYFDKVGKVYEVDISGSPPFTIPLCEEHRDALNQKRMESISIGYVGEWDQSRIAKTEMYDMSVLVKNASLYKRATDYVKKLFGKI